MSKVCVIGGSGFLGSHLADQLTDMNYDVTLFDIKKSQWLKKSQKMVIGDITNFDELKDALKDCDVVYNYAGLSNLDEALSKPISTVKLNILANVYVLEASRINNIKRFVYASSQYVNSREGSFYRCSKIASEAYIEEYKKHFDFTILRFGSLYGPRSGPDNGVYRIIRDAIKFNKISYQGNINSIREYIHIYDAAKSSIEILSKEFINKTIVLTGQQSHRVYEVLNMLGEIMGIEDDIEFRNEENLGHYIRTPYSYKPLVGRKYTPKTHIDLGQGMLDLVYELKNLTK